jgi:hypothetical protein
MEPLFKSTQMNLGVTMTNFKIGDEIRIVCQDDTRYKGRVVAVSSKTLRVLWYIHDGSIIAQKTQTYNIKDVDYIKTNNSYFYRVDLTPPKTLQERVIDKIKYLDNKFTERKHHESLSSM